MEALRADFASIEFWLTLLMIALIPAFIARSKGRDFKVWYIYGIGLFIVALIHAVLMNKDTKVLEEKLIVDGAMKRCEFCAELIKIGAKLCRFCGKEVRIARSVQEAPPDIHVGDAQTSSKPGIHKICAHCRLRIGKWENACPNCGADQGETGLH